MVSVIVPIYNVSDYLEEAIISILRQTYKNLEVILVDDGSTDNSAQIIEKFVCTDNRVKCIHQKNQGLSAARNTGLNNSKGNYIFFFDSDDVLHPQALEILLDVMIENRADVVICSHCLGENVDVKWTSKSFSNMKYEIKDGRSWIIDNVLYSDDYSSVDLCCAWGKLYKRKYLEGLSFPVGKLREDEYTTYKLLYKGKKVAYYKQPLYFYRKRIGSIMDHKSDKNYIDCYEALNERIHYFEYRDEELCNISKLKCLMYLYSTIKELHNQRKKRKKIYKYFVEEYKKNYKKYYKNIKNYVTKKQIIKYLMAYKSSISRSFLFKIIMSESKIKGSWK